MRRTRSQSSAVQLDLSRRERAILEVLYQKGEASGQEVRQSLANPPSYSAVRATLRILENKGVVCHKEQGLRYVFSGAQAIDRESPPSRSGDGPAWCFELA